ncbi:hypothetical protein CDG79_24050 [Nostoc sp. 'Peltigera membranacea cyanobiont' 232]|nr:hypothetical protein CDG79_24050 [Nostoc sp. 'Peltigera membranacea cyanobiont' 232]
MSKTLAGQTDTKLFEELTRPHDSTPVRNLSIQGRCFMPFFGQIAKKASGATIYPDSRFKAEC